MNDVALVFFTAIIITTSVCTTVHASKGSKRISRESSDVLNEEGDPLEELELLDASCPDGWKLYEKEECCLKLETEGKTWEKARKLCQSKEGDVVQQVDEDKEEFFRQYTALNSGRRYWVGLSDLDRDGTYEWINGTKLHVSSPGIGMEESYEEPGPKVDCVVKEFLQPSWEFMPCSMARWFVCEKCQLPPTNLRKLGTCTSLTCECDRKTWIHYEPGNIYFQVNNVARDYDEAASVCRHLGGELLSLPDQATQTFLKSKSGPWSPPWGMMYWLGLRRADGVGDRVWAGQDGTNLTKESYSNWWATPNDDLNCAGVVWHYEPSWRATHCQGKNYFLCQSKDPCSVTPAFAIGDMNTEASKKGGTRDISVTNDQEATVTCYGVGYSRTISKASLKCTDKTLKGTGTRSITVGASVDITKHGMVCTCTLTLRNGKRKDANFRINFRTRPRLATTKKGITTYGTEFGQTLTMKVGIYANPEPRVTKLSRNETLVSPDAYKATISAAGKPLYYTLTLSMPGFKYEHTGFYTVRIENGIETSLEYDFNLQEILQEYEWSVLWIIPIVIIGAILMVIALTVLYSGSKRISKVISDILHEEAEPVEEQVFEFEVLDEYKETDVDTAKSVRQQAPDPDGNVAPDEAHEGASWFPFS